MVASSIIDDIKAAKSETEIEGTRRAYLHDGAFFVRWLAWLENKLSQGFDVAEYEAAWRLTEFRKQNKHYWGLHMRILVLVDLMLVCGLRLLLAVASSYLISCISAVPHYSPTDE
jgi:Xaa-Pro aminopeptidase